MTSYKVVLEKRDDPEVQILLADYLTEDKAWEMVRSMKHTIMIPGENGEMIEYRPCGIIDGICDYESEAEVI